MDKEICRVVNVTDHFSGFQPDHVNLAAMKDVVVKLMFIGDGMSGKTQILITFAKLLLGYFQRIFSLSNKLTETEPHIITPMFQNWAERHGFLLRYGKTTWDIRTVSLDTETVGLEDFEYVFPYIRNGNTYRIKFLGNDVGGQNIFDHFRAVLGKMVGPDDNLIVVFDKSRELSCYISIEQIKKVLGIVTTHRRWSDKSIQSRIIYCGNKIDLEKHIQSQKWNEVILESIMNKITNVSTHGSGEYSIPSLMGDYEKERVIKYKIENNQITFPDLEALFYNTIRESDNEYGTKLMSEVNTKALCREIAAQLVYAMKTLEMQEEPTQVEHLWKKFRSMLFQTRPLAIQYSGGFQQNDEITYYGRIRDKWREFGLNLPISKEAIATTLHRTANTGELLGKMGDYFDTNAISGNGIMKMMDFIVQETLAKFEDPNLQDKRRLIKRKVKKF